MRRWGAALPGTDKCSVPDSDQSQVSVVRITEVLYIVRILSKT